MLVLERMEMARKLVPLIREMYASNTTTFEVMGCPVARVSVRRGIRQGCPMSGSLFALSLDPLLRWLMWQRFLATARYFAFADGLAAVLAQMRSSLPRLLEAFEKWRRASGLMLKMSKTVFIPLWENGLEEMTTYLREDLGIASARAACNARYLGVTVSTDTRGAQWKAVAEKVKMRAVEVACCGASIPTKMRLYSIHCGSIFRYRAQFARPDKMLLQACRVAEQRVCSAPWMSFPPQVLHNAEALGWPGSIAPALDLCRAARWSASSRSTVLHEEWRLFDDALRGDDAALAVQVDAPYRRAWHAHSSVTAQLRAEYPELQAFLRAHNLGATPAQRLLLKEMRPQPDARERSVAEVLRRRCGRWAMAPEELVEAVFQLVRHHLTR